MKVLLAPTEDFIKRERSALAADAAAGSNVVLTLQNVAGFAVNNYVCVGAEGTEQAELAKITAVSGETITVDALKLAHKTDESIVVFRYNQRKFYGSLTSGGSYTELTLYGSPAAIGVNNPQGTYLEYTGSEGYLYFKSTYFNSTDSSETALTDATETLADESTRYTSIFSIRKQAGITQNPYIDDGRVEQKRKQAENEVNSYIFEKYSLPLTNSTGTAEIPDLITRVTTLLAAGYLDYEEYGAEGEGVKWLGKARGILNALQKGAQRLIDKSGAEFTVKTRTQGIRGWPNAHDDDSGEPRFFTMSQRF